LAKPGFRPRGKVMIGGLATTDDFAKEIGADFRGKDAYEGVEQAKRFSMIR